MVVITLRFLTGRFHATPWGRHVNEAAPEWPPSPYRLLRALIDAWRRKRPEWPAARVEPVLQALASAPPSFVLPPAAVSQTRSFLSINTKDATDRTLIFDGFVVVRPSDEIHVVWPTLDLAQTLARDLAELLSLLNYMGRSESWIEARLGASLPAAVPNAFPDDGRSHPAHEPVRVACPLPPAEWMAQPDDAAQAPASPKKTRANKATVTKTSDNTVHLTWLEALMETTAELFASRRSDPPALRMVPYLRPRDCFALDPAPAAPRSETPIEAVQFALEGKLLPPVTATLLLAEQIRKRLMGIHKRLQGDDPARVSRNFSGKEATGQPLAGHRHSFILPIDQDGDGRLDHFLVVARGGLDRSEQQALDRLNTLWQPGGGPELHCLPLVWTTFADSPLFRSSRRWQSSTPFVPPRHHRRGRGPVEAWLANELAREAAHHGLPAIVEVQPLEMLTTPGRPLRWFEFYRSRKGDVPRSGHGFVVEFETAVRGPIALGYGCHFGLGQFVPSP